ncbi:MAG: VOC family protein [Ruminococcus sp.]|nr:VOC family protein [Ruminococcus sp.]
MRDNTYGIVGTAHIGLPTNDLKKTIEFYEKLGFEVIMETFNEKANEKVAFLQIKNYCIESFENGQAAMADGAYQHVALDVEDIEEAYTKICEDKHEIITDGIEELPFWENGVKFFMIKGPNQERIEFCQKL